MSEDFLHYVWKYKLFSTTLFDSNNKTIEVITTGFHNKNSGPDFLNSKIKIDNQLWVGNIEIHIKSSDWYLHNHENDKNYDAVILHIVWEDDVAVYMKNNKPLPTLILKNFVVKKALANYRNLMRVKPSWIPCEKDISKINKFTFSNWKERLFLERLERKSNEVNELLIKKKNDFEWVLFILLAKNFGLKVNAQAFYSFATSFDFKVLKKVRFDETKLMALFYGQAGFLEEDIEDRYYKNLKEEYIFLKHKYTLNPISKTHFSFFRMRPNNFPTIRIAQLTALYVLHQNLFSKVLNINSLQGFYEFFSINIQLFWKTHYTFEKESKVSSKKLTKSFVDLLIINTVIPLKFLYEKNKGEVNEELYFILLKEIKPENNSIITKFKTLNVPVKNAFDSQSLLELKNNYCAPKRCLECAIGKTILDKK